MLSVVKQFQEFHMRTKPIVVADAAMLSRANIQLLETEGYRYIVGARLANTSKSFIDSITAMLPRREGATIRLSSPDGSYDVICTYSEQRDKKDRRQFEKQITQAKTLITHQEAGNRAKFVKKSNAGKALFMFDEELKDKTEKLLGVKGYCTNIAEDILSNQEIVAYYMVKTLFSKK